MSNSLTEMESWKNLVTHANDISQTSLRELFHSNPDRYGDFHLQHSGLVFDYSRQKVSKKTIDLLIDLAKECDLENWRTKMFSGDHINNTEDRAVLHTALRRPVDQELFLDGENIMEGIAAVKERMKAFCDKIHSGSFTGFTGQRIDTIVNIGIGGSDLGPFMVCETLKPWKKENIHSYFVSNVDGTHISEVLKQINPETTLFLVASKTFTTQETMTNAQTAKDWLLQHLENEKAVAQHFAAMSTNKDAVTAFGIDPDLMFPFENWVGGRFSLWSAIGLSIALTIGYENFEELLSGAYDMDHHFQEASLKENIPALLALIGIWNRNFLGYPAYAVLPYDQYLHRFPAFLQQLDMESNGKYLTREGEKVDYKTGPLVFGEPGTNGQHAFFQHLHQGTDITPCDFIAPITSQNKTGNHHQLLLTNMIAQAEAMMKGRTIDEANGDQQCVFEGNRPSNILLFQEINPFHLGQLIALYEHKIFVQGVIWGINSFDQFGVELGKEMANQILSGQSNETDSIGILQHIKKHS